MTVLGADVAGPGRGGPGRGGPGHGSGTRTRSIWWNQLVLCAGAVVIGVVVLAVSPAVFAAPLFVVGLGGVLALTAATLALPWGRIPEPVVFVVPFLDIAGIGLTATADPRFCVLWAFPVIWIATYASIPLLVVALVAVAAIFVVLTLQTTDGLPIVPVAVVLVTTAFIGVSAHAASRGNRAARHLLRAQAARHRRTMLRLAALEERWDALAEAVTDAVARVGEGGRLDFVDSGFAALYGVDPLDLSQPPGAIEYAGRRASPIAETDRPVARAGRGEEFTDEALWLFDRAGRWRAVRVTSRRDGEAAMLLLVRDVTALEQARAERSPLGVGLKRADAEAAPISYDLGDVLTASAASYEAAARAADVALQLDVTEPLTVVGDPFRMRQAVDALLSNAVRYTRQGGRVFVSGLVREGRVITTITDTGIGISLADAARLTEPGFRTAAAVLLAPGEGMGLTRAGSVVEEQDGALTVDSRPDAGTTVTVDLPGSPRGCPLDAATDSLRPAERATVEG